MQVEEKNILGLDLGTNSIGWALIEQNHNERKGKILGRGSRIIPMSQDVLDSFGAGMPTTTQTAERTRYRGARHLRERYLLRRERLHRVLNVLGFLPKHYAAQIDFEKRFGNFIAETEPKLAYNNKDFLFKKSFEEMLDNFKKNQPELLNRKNRNGEDAKIPYDWTIFYLRKNALHEKIKKEELSWLILNFNQKRGYYQSRDEEEENASDKLVEFRSLKIIDVKAENANKKGEIWYSLILENGWIYRRSSKIDLSNWKDKVRDFIVTTELNADGSVKTNREGKESRSFRSPSEDDWTLLKKKTEHEIEKYIETLKIEKIDGTVGAYIYDALLHKPSQKIRGKLIRTIERKYYKDELKAILRKQIELQPELFTDALYNDCVRELYRNNEVHRIELSKRDFVHLFVDDIIFYQRPLKSQKSSIGNCSLEFRIFKTMDKDEKKVETKEYLKVISKSHPLYQEFRIWQWLFNLRILKKDDDTDVTLEFLKSIKDWENLFSFLIRKKEVDHKDILKYLLAPRGLKGKAFNAEIAKYRWNYVYDSIKDESKIYPCNETDYEIRRRLEKVKNVPVDFLTPAIEQQLWHLIYSVTDKVDFEKAINSFSKKHGLDQTSFVENFIKFPPFKSEYGSYSEKAIKKLLPLMRLGKYWNWENIDTRTKNRIGKIMTGEYDEEIKNRVREKALSLTKQNHFQGVQLWLAQYIVYDRHAEAALAGKWKSIADLENYLEEFKQYSLRNPIVEQVVTETLRVVKDIWMKYGNGIENFFDEIHIELGREMKNTAEERSRINNQVIENENTNLRIKSLLAELKNDNSIRNIRPYSPTQQETLKIYEEYALTNEEKYNKETGEFVYEAIPDDILKISKAAQPTQSELTRYKLWLEQKYRSPYTGEIIPLSRLFTNDYEVEHIIPQSRFFDDSFSNKVICETAVNQLKDNQLGMEFIKNNYGEKVETGLGKIVEIFSEENYKDFINKHYAKNRSKKTKLLLEDIPEKMIERQLNDTRYISKFISNVLSNIVRARKDDDGINSKNIIPGNGRITSTLKQDWGLNDVWNELILPRFKRMNKLTQSEAFTSINTKKKIIPAVPMELSKGFQKKRIDHRHHALDALVVACTTRDHVNLLNNQYAKSETNRYDLQRKLRSLEEVEYIDRKTGKRIKRKVPKDFLKPWDTITENAHEALENIVVSIKQNLRIINKTTNKYEKFVEKNNKQIKELVTQIKGDHWAIRKPLHKETVSGEVTLNRIKVPKGKILTATRKIIDASFDLKAIETITDTGIQKILKNYLVSKNNSPELAFSPEGLEEMNKNIVQYNDGKLHQPIYKARVFEVGGKFSLGETGNKKTKFVEAAKGTNLFFAIYQNANGKRSYQTIPLNIVIERQKQGLLSIPDTNENGEKLIFHLSPNDLVYVPDEDEKGNVKGINFRNLNKEQVKRIYKFTDGSGVKANFIPINISNVLFNLNKEGQKKIGINYKIQNEIGVGSQGSKNERAFTGETIKSVCIKLSIDRLGNIKSAIQ